METVTITLEGLPRILFAHGYRTGSYHMRFPARPGMWEITYVEQGDVTVAYEDGSLRRISAPSIHVADFARACRMDSAAPLHSHFTVGFLLEGKGEAGMPLRLPRILPMDQHNSRIEHGFRDLVRTYARPDPLRELAGCRLLLELMEGLARAALEDPAGTGSPVGQVYARRAMDAVTRRLDRPIRVEEIAADLGLSSSHLSRVFKAETGCTLVAYIHRAKLERVKELLLAKNLTLREAGEQVGIADENYLSRLFHRYTGMTVREYRALRVTL